MFIGFVLCAVAAAVFFASVYRAVFFKVLIGADGFFIPAAVFAPAVFFRTAIFPARRSVRGRELEFRRLYL